MVARPDTSEAVPSMEADRFFLPLADRRSSDAAEPLCWERSGETVRQYSFRQSGLGSGSGSRSGSETLGGGQGPRKGGRAGGKIVHVDFGREKTPVEVMTHIFHSFLLPDGYPDSVTPSYTPYMRWRAVQYFFGGAMSVFTTRSLLHSLGIAKGGKAASAALAVNWVIKDGAGRLGKMLFARQGKKFDADLKQMRLTSSMLMGLGAGLELSTVAAPGQFLPLACLANVLKNVGAVTNTSTRAPIYKAFARKENLGDITAKGESISNMADLVGTGFGILLARRNPSLQAAFWTLSLGYLIASYNEIRAVHLPTLNRSRFSVAVKKFLETGAVPSISEVSRLERIVAPPWATERPVEIGVPVRDAFEGAEDFRLAQEQCAGEQFLVTFRPSQRKAYVVLRDGAATKDVLQGAFRAHLVVHHLRGRSYASDQARLQEALAEHSQAVAVGGPGGGTPEAARACDLELQRLYHCAQEADEWDAAAAEAPLATLRYNWQTGWLRRNARERARQHALTPADVCCALAASKESCSPLFEEFLVKAHAQGWVMAESLLNPGDARLLPGRPPR